MIATKLFKAFLLDTQGRAWYWDSSTQTAKVGSTPRAIKHLPREWMDQNITWGRSSTYFGLDRSFTNAYSFVKDADKILRYRFFNFRGIEEKMYLSIVKLVAIGTYDWYYIGEIDFSKIDNTALTDFKVNLIEGGPSKDIKAHETEEYPFAPDDDWERVVMDGIILQDAFNYAPVQAEFPFTINLSNTRYFTVPVSFINNEGDNVNVIKGDQAYQDIGGTHTDFNTVENCLFKNGGVNPTPLIITGMLPFRMGNLSSDIFTKHMRVLWIVNNGITSTIYEQASFDFNENQDYSIDLSNNITLQINEKLFLSIVITATSLFSGNHDFPITFGDTNIKFSFTSKNAQSSVWWISLGNLFKKICAKVTKNTYPQESELFASEPGIGVTSGDLIRGVTTGVVSTTLKEFFDNTSKLLGGALGVDYINKIIREETKEYFFDNNTLITTVDNPVNFHITVAEDYLFNQISVGYDDQTYEERNGKYEFNSEQTWLVPQTRVNKKLDLKLSWRADCYGIEFLRQDFFNKDTTDSGGDKDIFLLDTTVANLTDIPVTFAPGSMTLAAKYADYFYTGRKFTIDNTFNNDGTFIANTILLIGTNVVITATGLTTEISPNTTFGTGARILRRDAYPNLAGVPTDTVFNIRLSPRHILERNWSYIGGAIFNLGADKVEFSVAKKNAALISDFPEILSRRAETLTSYYRPYIFEFSCTYNLNIINLLSNAGKGYVAVDLYTQVVYGFPLGISIKPAFKEEQTWQLLCSSLTDVKKLEKLKLDFVSFTNQGVISHKLPVKFVPLDVQRPAQYHFDSMDAEWFINRINRYFVTKNFYQPFQSNDTIELQFITKSVSIVVDIIRCDGVTAHSYVPNIINNPKVTNPNVLWGLTIPLTGLQGTYYVVTTFGTGDNAKSYISEPLNVQDDWPETLLFEYTNSEDEADMVFTAPYTGKLRVPGIIQHFKPLHKRSFFVDEQQDAVNLRGEPYRTYQLFIGNELGVPDWMIDKINRILLLDNVMIDGVAYTIDEDVQLEPIEVNGNPQAYWTIAIREANNRPGIPVDGSGLNESPLTIEYKVNARAFTSNQTPVNNQQDSLIQLIDTE